MDFWMFMNAYSIHDESGKASGRKPFFIDLEIKIYPVINCSIFIN